MTTPAHRDIHDAAWPLLATMNGKLRAAEVLRRVSPSGEVASLRAAVGLGIEALAKDRGRGSPHLLPFEAQVEYLLDVGALPQAGREALLAAGARLDELQALELDRPAKVGGREVVPDAQVTEAVAIRTRDAAGLILDALHAAFGPAADGVFAARPTHEPKAPLAWVRAMKGWFEEGQRWESSDRKAAEMFYARVEEAWPKFRQAYAGIVNGTVSDEDSLRRLEAFRETPPRAGIPDFVTDFALANRRRSAMAWLTNAIETLSPADLVALALTPIRTRDEMPEPDDTPSPI